MNAKTILCCMFFFCFGFFAKAEEIPGGIVYSDGKDAIYYDFETKESKNLTSDLNGAVIKSPFAVSENGEHMVWGQADKFYVMDLPNGNPYVVSCETRGKKEAKDRVQIGGGEKIDLIWQRDVRNLSLSPDGSRFAFESVYTDIGWVLLDAGNPSTIERFATAGMLNQISALRNHTIFNALPLFVKKMDSCNGIFLPSTNYNAHYLPITDVYKPVFGNLIERTVAVPFYKATNQDLGQATRANDVMRPLGHGLVGSGIVAGLAGGGDINGIKRNACFLTFQKPKTWEKDKKLVAFIYHNPINGQWGPIEIRSINSQISTVNDSDMHYGIFPKNNIPPERLETKDWKISISLPVCEGLAWRPDGSLSFLSQGVLYLVETKEIQEGINASSVEAKPNRYNKKKVSIFPVNNVFRVNPKPIAREILGTCLYWVSDDSFIFLNRNRDVCLWSQNRTEKLFSSIPSEFYYCEKSPFASPAAIGRGKGHTRDRISDLDTYADISVGYIKTTLYSHRTFWTDKIGNQEALGSCVVDESDFNNIKDPSVYTYIGRATAFAPEGKILILKNGDKFSAIKVTEDRTVPDKFFIGKSIKGKIVVEPYDPGGNSAHSEVSYEWASWDMSPPKSTPVLSGISDRQEDKLNIQKTLETPKFQKQTIRASEPFYIEGIEGVKFQWEDAKIGSKNQFILIFDYSKKNLEMSDRAHIAFLGLVKKISKKIDPLQYNYVPAPQGAVIPRGTTVILKFKDCYVAIKPIKSASKMITFETECFPKISPTQ